MSSKLSPNMVNNTIALCTLQKGLLSKKYKRKNAEIGPSFMRPSFGDTIFERLALKPGFIRIIQFCCMELPIFLITARYALKTVAMVANSAASAVLIKQLTRSFITLLFSHLVLCFVVTNAIHFIKDLNKKIFWKQMYHKTKKTFSRLNEQLWNSGEGKKLLFDHTTDMARITPAQDKIMSFIKHSENMSNNECKDLIHGWDRAFMNKFLRNYIDRPTIAQTVTDNRQVCDTCNSIVNLQ